MLNFQLELFKTNPTEVSLDIDTRNSEEFGHLVRYILVL